MKQEDLIAELDRRCYFINDIKDSEFTVSQYHEALTSKGISITRRGVQDRLSNMTTRGEVSRRIAKLPTGKPGYAYKFTQKK